MVNDKNHLQQFRTMFSDLRTKLNKLIDDCQRRIDEIELQRSKEKIAEPTVRVDDGEVFEISTKGKPEKD